MNYDDLKNKMKIKNTNTSKLEYSEILKSLFLKKITIEWNDKWKTKHGQNFEFNKLKSQNAFLDDLLKDLEKKLIHYKGFEESKKILISRDNLRRIFNQKKVSTWQERTRMTICCYLDFENFDDFLNHIQVKETPPEVKKAKKPFKIYNSYKFIITSLLFLTLIFISIYVMYFQKSKLILKGKNETINFPATVFFQVKIPKYSLSKPVLKIENETFNYIDYQKTFTSNEATTQLQFYTPGQKILRLTENSNQNEKINFLVGTGGNWYGCARIKSIQTPESFDPPNKVRNWYGLKKFNNNDSTNYITDFNFWNNYQISKESKIGTLSFPLNKLKISKYANRRVAFVKVEKFNLKMDNLKLTFKAQSLSTIHEDCLDFMVQLWDDEITSLQYYSSNNCEVKYNIAIIRNSIFKNYQANGKSSSNLNNILTDKKWHNFEILVKNQQIQIIIDGQLKAIKSFEGKFNNLREIWFVFEDNGKIDDVKLENTANGRIIFNDSF